MQRGVLLGTAGLHEPRAGQGPGSRSAERHLGVRRRALRDVVAARAPSRATTPPRRWRRCCAGHRLVTPAGRRHRSRSPAVGALPRSRRPHGGCAISAKRASSSRIWHGGTLLARPSADTAPATGRPVSRYGRAGSRGRAGRRRRCGRPRWGAHWRDAPRVTRFVLSIPPDERPAGRSAVTRPGDHPDGTRVVYKGGSARRSQSALRAAARRARPAAADRTRASGRTVHARQTGSGSASSSPAAGPRSRRWRSPVDRRSTCRVSMAQPWRAHGARTT